LLDLKKKRKEKKKRKKRKKKEKKERKEKREKRRKKRDSTSRLVKKSSLDLLPPRPRGTQKFLNTPRVNR